MPRLYVHAGDFDPDARHRIDDSAFYMVSASSRFSGDRIPFSAIASAELATTETIRRFGGGLVGLLGKLLLGNTRRATFVIQLKDDRKFVASTDERNWFAIVMTLRDKERFGQLLESPPADQRPRIGWRRRT